MKRTLLKSKIHRATVTEANLDYEGSVTIDVKLMEAGQIPCIQMRQPVRLQVLVQFLYIQHRQLVKLHLEYVQIPNIQPKQHVKLQL